MSTNRDKISNQENVNGHSHGHVQAIPEGKKPVLISMDGSECADYAFRWYMENLYRSDHYIIILHVPERGVYMVGPLGGTADVETLQVMIEEEEEREKAFLEHLAQKLKDGGIGGKVKSVVGKPGEVIVSVADEEKALFIVCGSRGRGTLRRTFLGSISDYVLHHSHVPVFICKHKDLHKEHGSGSPSLKHKIMNSPLFRRKNKNSPKSSPQNSPLIPRKETDSSGDAGNIA